MSNGKRNGPARSVAKGGGSAIIIWIVLLGVVLAFLWIFGFSLEVGTGIVENLATTITFAIGTIGDGIGRIFASIFGLIFIPFEWILNTVSVGFHIIDGVLPGDILPNLGLIDINQDELCSGSLQGANDNACTWDP